jgi:hypothetical protein
VLIVGHDRFPTYYGTEFAGKAMDVGAYQYRVQLDFIRPSRSLPLNDSMYPFSVGLPGDVRHKLEHWRQDYNQTAPCGTTHPRSSPRNGQSPQRAVRNQFRTARKSPQRAKY